MESATDQTFDDLEILLIDDCSTDTTPQILKDTAQLDPRICVYTNSSNLGVAETRNYGMSLARGKYIAFLDSDDVWAPDKLEQQISDLEERELDLSYTAYYLMDESGRTTGGDWSVPADLDYRRMLRENVIGCSTAVFRREAAEAGNLRMRGDYRHEDYVFWLEMLQNGCKAGGIDLPLMGYRIRTDSRNADKRKAAVERWRVYRQFLLLPWWRSAVLFISYGINSVKKHYLW